MLEEVKVRVLPDGRMLRADAAAYLGLQPKTLACWQSLGKGPCPQKMGGRVFYYLADLQAFLMKTTQRAA